MKKIVKILVACLMTVSFVGCSSGSSSSTGAQEALVNNFMNALNDADFEGMFSYCTSDNTDLGEFSELMDEFEGYQDASAYGDAFVEQVDEFMKNLFNELVDSYSIDSVDDSGDNCVITVSAKMKDVSSLSFDASDFSKYISDYQSSHLDELQETYLSDGEEAMMAQLYGGIAEIIFGGMIDEMKDLNVVESTLTFTIVEGEDGYLISSIS